MKSAHDSCAEAMRSKERFNPAFGSARPQTRCDRTTSINSSPVHGVPHHGSATPSANQHNYLQQSTSSNGSHPQRSRQASHLSFPTRITSSQNFTKAVSATCPVDNQHLLADHLIDRSYNHKRSKVVPHGGYFAYSYNPNGSLKSAFEHPTDGSSMSQVTTDGMSQTLALPMLDKGANVSHSLASATHYNAQHASDGFGGKGFNDMLELDPLEDPAGSL